MKNEAGQAVEKKISGVEKEQGSFKEAAKVEPPKGWGHSSVSSKGVGGKDLPGGGSK